MLGENNMKVITYLKSNYDSRLMQKEKSTANLIRRYREKPPGMPAFHILLLIMDISKYFFFILIMFHFSCMFGPMQSTSFSFI
jgi:hypothetical protein